MALNSWEEEALFVENGWEKDLIQRKYLFYGDNIVVLTFDDVVMMSSTPEGEDILKKLVVMVRDQNGVPSGQR